jgi:hypothetical protein
VLIEPGLDLAARGLRFVLEAQQHANFVERPVQRSAMAPEARGPG